MAKSVEQSLDDLRHDLVNMKQRLERLKIEGDRANIDFLERWIADAEKILSRWEGGDSGE